MKRALSLGAIGAGGALGASVRWAVNGLLPSTTFPWSTLLVNVVGCALLAFVTWSTLRADVRVAAGAGFCGGLTTFSAFAVEVVALAQDGRPVVAGVYVAASLGAGLAAFLLVRRAFVAETTVAT